MDADSIPPDSEVLNITENCRMCLTCITLYECGLTASEAAARAIARRVCLNDEGLSAILIQQVCQLYPIGTPDTRLVVSY